MDAHVQPAGMCFQSVHCEIGIVQSCVHAGYGRELLLLHGLRYVRQKRSLVRSLVLSFSARSVNFYQLHSQVFSSAPLPSMLLCLNGQKQGGCKSCMALPLYRLRGVTH